MLTTVQSSSGGVGVTTLAAVIASITNSIFWDCDPAGSSVAVWAGREPNDPVNEIYSWQEMERSWGSEVAYPPLDTHLVDMWGTQVLIGDISPLVQANTSQLRLATWADSAQHGLSFVADRGRDATLLQAYWRIVVSRPYRDALWRAWSIFGKEPSARTVWVLCEHPRHREDPITANQLSDDWGLEHCYQLPWDQKVAATISSGKVPPARSVYVRKVQKMCEKLNIGV